MASSLDRRTFNVWANPGICDTCGKPVQDRYLLHAPYSSDALDWLCFECNEKAERKLRRLRKVVERRLRRWLREFRQANLRRAWRW